MSVYFTADNHFGHSGARSLYRRPFASVAEMDRAMIDRWNSVVKPEDEIWHLGDVCDPSTLADFEQLGAPLHVIKGNCDADFGWPVSLELEREGVRFFLTHIPPEPARIPRPTHALLHGHTHVPRDETVAGVRWLNPGCITRPNRGARPSFAWLTVENGEIRFWELARV